MRVVNAGKAAALVFAALTVAACGDQSTPVATPGGTTEARGDVVLATTSLAPNLPAGSTTISSQGFETCAGDGWVNCAAATRDAQFAIVQDASAPASNPSVARYTFPSGFIGGDAPVPIIERGIPAGTKRLFGSFWFKLSPNWQGHNTGINKLGFVWIHGQPVVYLNAQGSGSAPLVLQVRTQGLGVGTSARTLGPNRGQSGVISRGAWHRLEYYLAANTAGQQNGAVRFWLDGTEIGSYTDVGFSSSTQRTDWELASVYPVWGGNGDRVSSTQQLFVDHYLLASATTSAPAPTPVPVPVARIAVVPSSFTLTVGGSQQLSATTYDANGATLTGRTITWSSSNAGVASVTATGLVSAVAAGSATLTATSEGQSATATVTVNAPAPQPAPVARVAVSPSSATLTVGGTQQLTATTYDANNATLTGRIVTWTSSNAAVASVSGSGLVTAVAAGSATVTATSEGRTASATITVNAPAPAPAPGGGQEPAGSTRLTERAFSLANEDGWLSPMGYWSIVNDATAPRSASQVGQILYPAGFGGGSEPVRLEKSFSQRFRTLYVSYWLKPSSNFVGHGTGVNKTLHLWIAGGNRIYLTMQGQGSGALLAQVNLQGIPTDGGARNLPPNVVTGAQIQRNQWQRWEIVAVANTPGVSDGSLEWWVNGTRVAHYTGLQFVRSGESNTWELIQVAPTWGGIGGTVPANQHLWLDHLYVSGR